MEEQRAKAVAEEKQKTSQYFEGLKVSQFFLASNANGLSKKPLIMGSLMEGKGWVDLHFKWAYYKREY